MSAAPPLGPLRAPRADGSGEIPVAGGPWRRVRVSRLLFLVLQGSTSPPPTEPPGPAWRSLSVGLARGARPWGLPGPRLLTFSPQTLTQGTLVPRSLGSLPRHRLDFLQAQGPLSCLHVGWSLCPHSWGHFLTPCGHRVLLRDPLWPPHSPARARWLLGPAVSASEGVLEGGACQHGRRGPRASTFVGRPPSYISSQNAASVCETGSGSAGRVLAARLAQGDVRLLLGLRSGLQGAGDAPRAQRAGLSGFPPCFFLLGTSSPSLRS